MLKKLSGTVLLLGALSLSLLAQAQQQPEHKFRLQSVDLAVTYSPQVGKVAPSKSDRFWMQGGSADVAVTLYRGFGVAASLTGQHASNITPGIDVNKITFVTGPRYTYNTARWTDRLLGPKHPSSVFGEALFGTVHGFNGLFPAGGTTVKSSANAFAMQVGGGIDIALAKGFGVRALQLDYFHSRLPNNGTDSQHELRMAFGVTYHIGRK